jgi:Secretion system C-terminal sorting domain
MISKKLLELLFLICAVAFSANISAQVPGLPEWIKDTIFIDLNSTNSGNGTIKTPYNSITKVPGWDGNSLSNMNSKAILFKRNLKLTFNSLNIYGDYCYVGAYGKGLKPIFQFNSTSTGGYAFNITGEHVTLGAIDIRHNNQLKHTVRLSGGGNGAKAVFFDSTSVTGGGQGMEGGGASYVEVKNVTIRDCNMDGFYSDRDSNVDSTCFYNVHISNVNLGQLGQEYSPGDCIQASGHFVRIESSFLDHSSTQGKFCFIATEADSCVIRNTMFKMNKINNCGVYARSVFAENCYFDGGYTGIWGFTNTRIYNCVFRGYGKELVHDSASIVNPYNSQNNTYIAVRSSVKDVYNCTFVDYYRCIEDWSSDIIPNVRNTIFYNIHEPYTTRYNITGSGNIHFNADLSEQHGMIKYLESDAITNNNTRAYKIIDPMFKDYKNGDFSLREGSPLIDTADPNVFDNSATFLTGRLSGSNWVLWKRKYTQYLKIKTDINGVPRPLGEGYDIGAYEFGNIFTDQIEDGTFPDSVFIFPNPVDNVLNVLVMKDISPNHSLVKIYNSQGKMIYASNELLEKNSVLQIQTTTFAEGFYVLTFTCSENKIISKKFIVSR